MAISIDWGTRVITVPQADLTHVGGTNYELDTEAFRIALKDLEDNEGGIVHPKTHNHNTSVLLGGIEYARIIEIINGYTVTFEEKAQPYAVNFVGSNNNILDVANLGTVSFRSNNSAGLIQTREIQYASFAGGVWVDEVNGSFGTTYPAGTERQPVNNYTDALSIATLYGFNTFYIRGNSAIAAGLDYTNYVFVGQGQNLSTFTIAGGANVTNCTFIQALVTGTLDGDSHIEDCIIEDLTFVSGVVERCLLNPGTITLGGSSTAHFIDCKSGEPGLSTPIIDCGGSGQGLALRNYDGGIEVRNKTGPEEISLGMDPGDITLASTVTNGTILCRGTGYLFDNSVGATVVDRMVNKESTAVAVWEYERP